MSNDKAVCCVLHARRTVKKYIYVRDFRVGPGAGVQTSSYQCNHGQLADGLIAGIL